MPIFIVLFLCLLSTQVIAKQLVTANSHWPPWRVIDKNGAISGIEIDILKKLSTRLELQLITKGCGWNRCLKYMQVGEGDVMTGLFKTPEREHFLKFIDPPYRSVKKTCFYQKKDNAVEINDYQDLHKLTIGVVKKVAYFEPFNSDKRIKKHHSTTDDSSFRLLKAQNIDAVIMGCAVGDVRLKRLGLEDDFKHANYVHSIAHPVYLAISKRSPLIARADDVEATLKNMIKEGEIRKIMTSYGILETE